MDGRSRRFLPRFIALVALLAVSSNALAAMVAIPGLFNTGVDANGAVLPNGTLNDLHYTLVQAPAASTTTTRIITSAGGFPIGPYVGDNTTSRWLVPNNAVTASNPPGTDPGDVSPPGDYVFATTFDLTGYDPSSASISGQWSTDNAGFITVNSLNGSPLATTSPTQYSSWAAFVISSGFQAGLNTLYFHVNNLDDGAWPVGLRVEMTGLAAPVPLPPALWLLASGLVGLAALRRRSV